MKLYRTPSEPFRKGFEGVCYGDGMTATIIHLETDGTTTYPGHRKTVS